MFGVKDVGKTRAGRSNFAPCSFYCPSEQEHQEKVREIRSRKGDLFRGVKRGATNGSQPPLALRCASALLSLFLACLSFSCLSLVPVVSCVCVSLANILLSTTHTPPAHRTTILPVRIYALAPTHVTLSMTSLRLLLRSNEGGCRARHGDRAKNVRQDFGDER